MLEYFGFYDSPRETPTPEQAQHEAAVARAARLGERPRHTPSVLPVTRAWDRNGPRDDS